MFFNIKKPDGTIVGMCIGHTTGYVADGKDKHGKTNSWRGSIIEPTHILFEVRIEGKDKFGDSIYNKEDANKCFALDETIDRAMPYCVDVRNQPDFGGYCGNWNDNMPLGVK